ncbi:hypothetical protein [Halarchaeum sp. P4]|uniref:hypothetical protein n=1 Tax=Halarchaeum sp. P4 TaxID=3421639 RepID=UPI003EB9D801
MQPQTFTEGAEYDVPGHEESLTFRRIDWSAFGSDWDAVFELESGLEIGINRSQLEARDVYRVTN